MWRRSGCPTVYEIRGDGDPLEPEPAGGEQRRDYERAQRARGELAHDLGREAYGDELGLA